MKTSLALLLLFLSSIAFAEETSLPLHLEADSKQTLMEKHQSIYRGNVIAIQGERKIQGDKLIVHTNQEEKLEKIIVTGKPATIHINRQEEPIIGEALKITYYAQTKLIELRGKAIVSTPKRLISSEKIDYNSTKKLLNAGDENGKTRVKIELIQ